MTSDSEPLIQPLAWDENGNLVPLDATQRERLLKTAEETVAERPRVNDHQQISKKRTRELFLIDVAHIIDACFSKKEDSGVRVIWVQGTLFMLMAIGLFIWLAWPLLLAMVILVGGFRYWVWTKFENKLNT